MNSVGQANAGGIAETLLRLGGRLFIDGKLSQGAEGDVFPAINPSTGTPFCDILASTAEDVDRAVRSSRRAFDSWRWSAPQDRNRILMRFGALFDEHYEALSFLDCLEMGAPISFMRTRLRRLDFIIRFHAAAALMIRGETIPNSITIGTYGSRTIKEPIGVVGAIVPWNVPIQATLTKLMPALASGCTVVLKPSEESTLSALRIAELCTEAGVPDGVVNVVPGLGSVAGAALVSHPGVNKVSFTGSVATGQHIAATAARTMKRLTLELGGKSPNIVCADANLDKAVAGAAMGVFANTGQMCTAASRLYVERSIHDQFLERLTDYCRNLVVGSAADQATQIGPVASATQKDRIEAFLREAQAEGGSVMVAKDRELPNNGFYVAPTIVGNVPDDSQIVREEIFGPVVRSAPFDTIEEAIARANDTTFGLAGGIWTSDARKAELFSREVRAGNIWINCYNILEASVPFGGYGMSGIGREGGSDTLEPYLETKAIWQHFD